MPNDRSKLRVKVLAEDKRQERFLRALFESLGFARRNISFNVAPAGAGAAEAWVRKRFPSEVKALRSKNYQTSLRLVAMRDGDAAGVTRRKNELMTELAGAGLDARQDGERIALPVPTWSIETWLLAILGSPDVSETESLKSAFPPAGRSEREALLAAAANWPHASNTAAPLPSLADGVTEIARLLES